MHYIQSLQALLRTLQISDADMEWGQLRCDVNVSLKAPDGSLGERVEIKNMNSVAAMRKAIEHEVATPTTHCLKVSRQTTVLDGGGVILQETRGWNPEAKQTFVMRTKGEFLDYRFMPEPDLPPLVIDEALLEVFAV